MGKKHTIGLTLRRVRAILLDIAKADKKIGIAITHSGIVKDIDLASRDLHDLILHYRYQNPEVK